MKTNMELTEYMNGAVERLVKNTILASAKNPQTTIFLMKSRGYLKAAQEKRMQYEQEGIHIPAFLISSITKSCNLFCTGCYARANGGCSEENKEPAMGTADWGRVFKESTEAGISFHLLAGGEPLMRKDIILEAGKNQECIFPVFTNGTLINEEYISIFRKNRNLIPIISMEGLEETTDLRRGEGIYEKLLAVLKKLKEANLLYGVSITVSKNNIEEVSGKKLMDVLDGLGCKLIFFIEYVPVDQTTAHLAFGDEERERLDRKQKELREQYKDMIYLSFPGDEKYMGGCLAAGRGFFHINPDGFAEACPFSPYSDMNIKEKSLLEVLGSPLFQAIREENLGGEEHSGGCALFEQEAKVMELQKRCL